MVRTAHSPSELLLAVVEIKLSSAESEAYERTSIALRDYGRRHTIQNGSTPDSRLGTDLYWLARPALPVAEDLQHALLGLRLD
jgi:hypothetical protein